MDSTPNPSGFDTMANAIEFANNYNNWILSKFRNYVEGSLLEIGTGQGNFRKYFKSISNYISIDLDESVIERAKARNPNDSYFKIDITKKEDIDKLKKYPIDTILCVNVLEHIEDDKQAIENMMSLLKPEGNLLLFVPAFGSIYNKLDELAGHYRRYNRSSIKKLVENQSYQIVLNQYFNPIGFFTWWVQKFFTHKNLNSDSINKQVIFFDKFIVPISKLFNPLTKLIFGQSVICVIKKK